MALDKGEELTISYLQDPIAFASFASRVHLMAFSVKLLWQQDTRVASVQRLEEVFRHRIMPVTCALPCILVCSSKAVCA